MSAASGLVLRPWRLGRARIASARRAAGTAALLLPLVFGGPSACYTQRALSGESGRLSTVAPGATVVVTLNDAGRVALAASVGPSAQQLEGRVTASSDSGLVLAMRESRALTGEQIRWSGESLTVPRAGVQTVQQREFSRRRTLITAGVSAAVFVALVATRTLNILGQPGAERPGGPPPVEQ